MHSMYRLHVVNICAKSLQNPSAVQKLQSGHTIANGRTDTTGLT